MVVPIIVGVGVTVAALVTRSTISAYRKYNLLTPAIIASLNNIKLTSSTLTMTYNGKVHPHEGIHKLLRQRYPRAGFEDKMTEREALLIMGIEGDDIVRFDKAMLKERYRKLMVMNHPDKNGSKYMAQKINQAKQVLEDGYMFRR